MLRVGKPQPQLTQTWVVVQVCDTSLNRMRNGYANDFVLQFDSENNSFTPSYCRVSVRLLWRGRNALLITSLSFKLHNYHKEQLIQ